MQKFDQNVCIWCMFIYVYGHVFLCFKLELVFIQACCKLKCYILKVGILYTMYHVVLFFIQMKREKFLVLKSVSSG